MKLTAISASPSRVLSSPIIGHLPFLPPCQSTHTKAGVCFTKAGVFLLCKKQAYLCRYASVTMCSISCVAFPERSPFKGIKVFSKIHVHERTKVIPTFRAGLVTQVGERSFALDRYVSWADHASTPISQLCRHFVVFSGLRCHTLSIRSPHMHILNEPGLN